VDRLAVLPDQLLVADYKTNRDAPAAPERVPPLYLRQMAAYRAVLRQLFPDRPIHCTLVWTRTATVMPLPPALLDAHAPGACPPA
jgi:ATP-dependent helicase/nuclease subunit A